VIQGIRRLSAANCLAALLLALTACSGSGGDRPSPSPTATATTPQTAAPGAQDWTTYHHDPARSGIAPGVPSPGRLAKAWSAQLDGAVYGQPLVIGQTVVAATEGDSVYGLDRSTGRVLWHRNLGTPVPLSDLPCGNIDPLGITGTPVYDAGTGRVFVMAETTGDHHTLVGLSIKDGSVQLSHEIAAPDGHPRNDQQRAALTLAQGRVYVAFGGLWGDCGQYVGSVVGVPVSGQGADVSWHVPTSRTGGIWGTGGPTVGSDGTLYVAVGNGAATSGAFDGSDSVTALSPDLKVRSQFAPSIWGDDNANDLDLGSMSPALVGDRVLTVGKRGTGYLLHAPALGGVGGQITQASVCTAYGGPAVDGTTVYVPCSDGGLAAVSTAGDHIRVAWRGPGSGNGSPVIGGGAVWVAGGGTLYALDARTGNTRARTDVGDLPHFASPTLSGSTAFIGTMSGVSAVAIS
jgi:outer membrane protein assembly factor BamB